jgi:hypothetical protein
VLVDLEARWENLRHSSSRDSRGRLTTANLLAIQNAYAAFRVKLMVYNKLYKPAHVPELLLNTPSRLSAWCRAMRNLYRQVESDSQGLCPVAMLAKAYRCAQRVSVLMTTGPLVHSTPPATVQEAIGELEALIRWCDDLTGTVASA